MKIKNNQIVKRDYSLHAKQQYIPTIHKMVENSNKFF